MKTGYLPRFHFSRKSFSLWHFSIFFSFPFLLPIPSLHKSAGFHRPSVGSKRRQKRSYLKLEEGFAFSRREKDLFCWEESLQKKQSSPKEPKTSYKGRALDHTDGRREEKGVEVGSGTRAGITLQSRLFQSVDLDYSRGSRAWADLCSVWAVRKLLRRWMPWWSQFWPWCFWGAGRRGPRTQSWGQWDHL